MASTSINENKKTPKRKRRRWFIIGICILLLPILWFFSVDLLFIHEECNYCHFTTHILQYRFLTIPIYEKSSESKTIYTRISQDLGFPCSHKSMVRYPRQRWWGLLYSAGHVTCCLTNGDGYKYEEIFKPNLRKLAKENPDLGKEFYERVLRNHNWDYWQRFKQEIMNDDMEKIATNINNLSTEKISEIVDRISNIKWVEFDNHEHQSDENANLILLLDVTAVPYLIEKITDESSSQWLAWGNVGDSAHIFISLITSSDWPSKEFREEHNLLEGNEPYWKFHQKFFSTPNVQQNKENRKKLQQAWREFVPKRMRSYYKRSNI